jgi:predicted DNA-binding transcriptional regulator AlpA
MSDHSLETLIDEKELARLIRVSIATLRYWRSERKGPRFRKVGQMVRYAPSDVATWLNSRPTGGEAVDIPGREAGVHA